MSNLLTISDIKKCMNPVKESSRSKRYKLLCDEGDFVSIIGPSGVGSLHCRGIAGFEKTNKGVIFLNGKTVNKPGPDRFMIFQG